jgi:hypothetical protein
VWRDVGRSYFSQTQATWPRVCLHTDAATVNVFDLYGTVLVAVDATARGRRRTPRGRRLALRQDNALQGLGAAAEALAPGSASRSTRGQPRHILLYGEGQSCAGGGPCRQFVHHYVAG